LRCTRTCQSSTTTRAWLEIRKAEALKIDPETAIVDWSYGQTMDPYGVRDLPPEMQQVGREFYCRRPDGGVWVSFVDDALPEETKRALWAKIKDGSANWEPATDAMRKVQADVTATLSKGRLRLVGDPPPSPPMTREEMLAAGLPATLIESVEPMKRSAERDAK
jgi:hypothetical protein